MREVGTGLGLERPGRGDAIWQRLREHEPNEFEDAIEDLPWGHAVTYDPADGEESIQPLGDLTGYEEDWLASDGAPQRAMRPVETVNTSIVAELFG